MSTEKSVRVRVKVYDNTTSIYSQDIEITAGEGTFIVPAILADSDVIALQVRFISPPNNRQNRFKAPRFNSIAFVKSASKYLNCRLY